MVIPILGIDVFEEVVAAVGSLLLPALASSLGLGNIFKKIPLLQKRRKADGNTSELLERLRAASSEMDSIISELKTAAGERSNQLSAIEQSIKDLGEKEKSLKERIAGTEGISQETVNTFAKIVESKLDKTERPKKRRDYALFAAGVILSALVGIALEATKPTWEKVLHIQAESVSSGNNGKVMEPASHSSTDTPK